jgi:protein-S-isoprenylcysteine O-methyltransferase Ste14
MDTQSQNPPTVSRQCFACYYQAESQHKQCPKCGSKNFLSATNVRVRGGVIALCGLFVAGLMGAISIWLWQHFANDPDALAKIQQEKTTYLAIFGLFGLLIVLGLHFVLTGGWMLILGKRNKFLVWAMLVFVGIVVVAGGLITVFL